MFETTSQVSFVGRLYPAISAISGSTWPPWTLIFLADLVGKAPPVDLKTLIFDGFWGPKVYYPSLPVIPCEDRCLDPQTPPEVNSL